MKRWAKQVGANGRPRKRSWREDKRQIERYLLPEWRHRKVKDITRRDVRNLVEAIAERRLRKGTTEDGQEKLGAPIMSNRVLALVKKMFNFALDREWIDANPQRASSRSHRRAPVIACSRPRRSGRSGANWIPSIIASRGFFAPCC